MSIDLNCDMGEGLPVDESLMPFITSANIACGAHAGDRQTMRHTLLLAKKWKVRPGAHPSYPDRKNFGRKAMDLSPDAIYELVKEQLLEIRLIASGLDMQLTHMKPHGALYHAAASDKSIAAALVKAVMDVDPGWEIFGPGGSFLNTEAESAGLVVRSEVFADRRYEHDGSLTPRTELGALIGTVPELLDQVKEMVEKGVVTCRTGERIAVNPQTICIHGDGPNALEFAGTISKYFHLSTKKP
jgi:UPF0271 protein